MQNTHLTDTKFSDLPIVDSLKTALKEAGFEHCTPIQSVSLPPLLEGKDVAGQAQTGTGKTMAFLVATFHRILQSDSNCDSDNKAPRAIIMAPTRELAVQIHKDAELLAKHTNVKLACIYGGDGYENQRAQLEGGADIIIGTTGRIIDFYKQGTFSLAQIEVAVLDEADRMFDLGFIKDIRYVFNRMPEAGKRLNMLFSATLSFRVQELAYDHMNSPTHVEIEPERKTGARIEEELFYPSHQDKMKLLLTLIEEEWPDKAVIFANTKHECENLFAWLQADGHRVGLLSGDVPQKKRLVILQQFSKGQLDFLVATDVAARGLHIDKVSHVFNYDLPDDAEDYVHRIGRTGRAGESGFAISFACEKYAMNLPAIEEYIEHLIPVTEYDSQALLDDIKVPKRQQTRKRHGKNNNHSNRKPRGQHAN